MNRGQRFKGDGVNFEKALDTVLTIFEKYGHGATFDVAILVESFGINLHPEHFDPTDLADFEFMFIELNQKLIIEHDIVLIPEPNSGVFIISQSNKSQYREASETTGTIH